MSAEDDGLAFVEELFQVRPRLGQVVIQLSFIRNRARVFPHGEGLVRGWSLQPLIAGGIQESW